MRVAVIGAGSWGTTIACLAAADADVILWARRAELADRINADHENPDYLAGFPLPEAVTAASRIDEALNGADLVMVAVPSHGYRTVLERARGLIPSSTPIVSLTKGHRDRHLPAHVPGDPGGSGRTRPRRGGSAVRPQPGPGDHERPAGRRCHSHGRPDGRPPDTGSLLLAEAAGLHQPGCDRSGGGGRHQEHHGHSRGRLHRAGVRDELDGRPGNEGPSRDDPPRNRHGRGGADVRGGWRGSGI